MEKKPSLGWKKVRIVDLLVILDNIHRGAAMPKRVGFVDANQSIEELTRSLNRRVWVKVSDIESGLWSCNLLDEIKHFRDPVFKRTFQWFLKDILGPGETFNKFFNVIEDESK